MNQTNILYSFYNTMSVEIAKVKLGNVSMYAHNLCQPYHMEAKMESQLV